MESPRVGHDWATELNWTEHPLEYKFQRANRIVYRARKRSNFIFCRCLSSYPKIIDQKVNLCPQWLVTLPLLNTLDFHRVGSISGYSVTFHWFLCSCISTTLDYTNLWVYFNISWATFFPSELFFFRFFFYLVLGCFKNMNFSIILSLSKRGGKLWIFYWDCIKICKLRKNATLMMLRCPKKEKGCLSTFASWRSIYSVLNIDFECFLFRLFLNISSFL